eukprot:CAMPEP_0170134960 /NCGR_PEP_ID=MMETSP0033_2-20121228/2221_1 /TAXON_ID=195969 /ORGANISM="Dolichomastix tenuilepis, Strain CCMP3274" /LENGTH=298 /DNA_ID=CAMNT_0010370551 /DNA_START=89 /DNA_END=981 /DNA_ORIENTATION=+
MKHTRVRGDSIDDTAYSVDVDDVAALRDFEVDLLLAEHLGVRVLGAALALANLDAEVVLARGGGLVAGARVEADRGAELAGLEARHHLGLAVALLRLRLAQVEADLAGARRVEHGELEDEGELGARRAGRRLGREVVDREAVRRVRGAVLDRAHVRAGLVEELAVVDRVEVGVLNRVDEGVDASSHAEQVARLSLELLREQGAHVAAARDDAAVEDDVEESVEALLRELDAEAAERVVGERLHLHVREAGDHAGSHRRHHGLRGRRDFRLAHDDRGRHAREQVARGGERQQREEDGRT